MNRVILYGNLVKDTVVRAMSNSYILNFTIAVKRNFKNQNNEYESDFINCKYFRKQDNISQYLKKGQAIIIEGRIQTGSYDDKEGKKVYTTDIVVNDLTLVGSKKESSNSVTPQEIEQNKVDNDPFAQEDIFKDFGDKVELDNDFLD